MRPGENILTEFENGAMMRHVVLVKNGTNNKEQETGGIGDG